MIISVTNQKGGVGKTVTSINLAAALGLEKKYRILLIDMDPQGHSSLCFLDDDSYTVNLYELFRGERKLADSIVQIKEEHFDLIPTGISLAKIERELISEVDGHFALKDLLEHVKSDYDIIIIDTPPALGMLTINCLVASDYIVIPIQASYLSLEGTEDLLDTIKRVKTRFNPGLEILGTLITIHDHRTVLGRDVVKRIQNVFGDKVFSTSISKSVRLEESPAYRESIFRYAPGSVSAREYRLLGKEVIERVDSKGSTG